MHLELFFKIGYVCEIPKRFGIQQDLTQFADKIWCDDYTGCDVVDNYFATEAVTIKYILYEYYLDEDKLRIFRFNSNIYKIVFTIFYVPLSIF